jgi:hypothetical protein
MLLPAHSCRKDPGSQTRFDGKVTESVAEALPPYPPLHSLDVLNTNC